MDEVLNPMILSGDSAKDRLTSVMHQIVAQAEKDDEGSFPIHNIKLLADNGLLRAFAPAALGGDRFQNRMQYVSCLFDCLRLVGRANLSLGRLFEGHVNALLLIDRYGDDEQRAMLAGHLRRSKLFGVWNTEPPPGMSVQCDDGNWTLSGAKYYATGAGFLDFAVVTARLPDGQRQMFLAPVGGVRDRADLSTWKTSGMRATVSGTFDFSNLPISLHEFLGEPDDYEREPMFTAGAWRFTAVQLGGIEALIQLTRQHICQTGADRDALQRARFGQAVAHARTAYLWVKEAANRAEMGSIDDAVPFVLMTRGVVEDAALRVIEAAQRGVGTRAFFTGNPIDRAIRDLQLYLRQPAPDQARDRAAAAWLERDRWTDDPWW